MSLVEFLTSVGLTTGVARSSFVYATVSAGHILGIALLLGPIILADLEILGRLPAFGARAIATLRRTARIGAGLAIATGILLLSSKPDEYFVKGVFLAKLATLMLALANAVLFEWRARRAAQSSNDPATGSSILDGLQATASLVLWLTVLALGRSIAFA